jgi:Domain of Unknown Function with PDB structure (DUF3857)/Transglutaminase-like superfamily
MDTRKWLFTCLLALSFVPLCSASPGRDKEDWPPIPPQDLALKDNPASPGSPAMILEKTFTRDESGTTKIHETVYYRIKILTEQGKDWADVEIPYLKNDSQIRDLQARTIHPDGKVIDFDGQTFDKTVVKYKTVKFFARTFTMPDVEPGSIIEYRYQVWWDKPYIGGRWILQEDLYLRHAVYTLIPYPFWTVHWSGRSLHGEQLQNVNGTARLEVRDTPAFVSEAYMPPEDETKPHLDYYYSEIRGVEAPDKFWQRIGKATYEANEKFIGNHKYVAEVAEQTVAPNDPPDVKLRKLYARVQQIRNLSFERSKTQKEEKREHIKDNHNVEDVLKHGYGDGFQIDGVFVAMARALGFDSALIHVARRSNVFFSRDLLNPYQLNDVVVWVHVGSEDVYLDPGTQLCPYGLLPWAESDTAVLRRAN